MSPYLVWAFFVLVSLNCLRTQVNCASSTDNLREELDRILDENGFDEDMIDLQEEKFNFQKYRKRSVKDSFSKMKIASLLAEIAQTKHAIKSKFVELSKGAIDGFDKRPEGVDLRELELFMARCLVRAKITILLNTSDQWKQVYKYAERYRVSTGKELDGLEMRNVLKDPLTSDLELQIEASAIERYKALPQEPTGDGSSSSSASSTLEQMDELIDLTFFCEEDCVALSKSPIAKGIAPLATSATVDEWRLEYIESNYRNELADFEQSLSNLALKDTEHRQMAPEEWNSVSLEQVEQFRQNLRSPDEEAEYRDNFNYFLD